MWVCVLSAELGQTLHAEIVQVEVLQVTTKSSSRKEFAE